MMKTLIPHWRFKAPVIVQKLIGGDRRSTGRADEVAEQIAADQRLFDEVFQAIYSDDPVLRMRAADAVEKASRQYPERLHPHKDALLDSLSNIDQHEVRWHTAQMLPRLPLETEEKPRAVDIARSFLRDKSTIVRVNALEALSELACGDNKLEGEVRRLLLDAVENGAPAEKARARKLLKLYEGR